MGELFRSEGLTEQEGAFEEKFLRKSQVNEYRIHWFQIGEKSSIVFFQGNQKIVCDSNRFTLLLNSQFPSGSTNPFFQAIHPFFQFKVPLVDERLPFYGYCRFIKISQTIIQ